jgi:hypothetical protein
MDAQDRRALERFRFWDGQALRSRDLRGQLEVEAQLRAWHNRAVHDPYGVRLGLAVTPQPAAGPLAAVQVAAGLAYDCAGRPLLVQRAVTVALPAAPGDSGGAMLLVASWRRDASYPERRLVDGACLACSGSPFEEAPALGWVAEATFEPTAGVALSRLEPHAGAWQLDPIFDALPVRALTRPHLHCASTLPGNPPWGLWRAPDPVTGQIVGAQLRVDTNAAGFARTPHYFAWLRGWNPIVGTPGPLMCLTHVANPTPTSFDFRVVFVGRGRAAELIARQGPSAAPTVLWLGCEETSPPGAIPVAEAGGCCC